MNDIFISYRRDDSAGQAGRLFDGLRDRFGDEHVFMDVTDLRPGQDFALELGHAVANADCVLAVIGPRWLDAVDASGRRRIDDPDDFVHREVAAGLAKGVSVIPVLVHGATMPRAEELPGPLRALARRQAIDLSDQRWDSDLRELVQLLLVDGKVGTTKPAMARGPKLGAITLVALALVVGAAWMAFNPSKRDAQIAESKPDAAARLAAAARPAPAVAGAAQPLEPAAPPQRFAIALPQVSEVRFRTNRAQVSFTIMSIRQEPRDSDTQALIFLVRMLNRGPANEVFGSDQFRLIVGDQTIAPTTSLISSIEATAAKETSLRFVAPSGVVDMALEVSMYA